MKFLILVAVLLGCASTGVRRVPTHTHPPYTGPTVTSVLTPPGVVTTVFFGNETVVVWMADGNN